MNVLLGVNNSIVPWSSRYSINESDIVLTNVSCRNRVGHLLISGTMVTGLSRS